MKFNGCTYKWIKKIKQNVTAVLGIITEMRTLVIGY